MGWNPQMRGHVVICGICFEQCAKLCSDGANSMAKFTEYPVRVFLDV